MEPAKCTVLPLKTTIRLRTEAWTKTQSTSTLGKAGKRVSDKALEALLAPGNTAKSLHQERQSHALAPTHSSHPAQAALRPPSPWPAAQLSLPSIFPLTACRPIIQLNAPGEQRHHVGRGTHSGQHVGALLAHHAAIAVPRAAALRGS